MTWRAMTKVNVGCGLCRTGRVHVRIGCPPSHNASGATGAFGGRRAARSRVTLRRNAANGPVAGEGEDGRPIVGFAVECPSFPFGQRPTYIYPAETVARGNPLNSLSLSLSLDAPWYLVQHH